MKKPEPELEMKKDFDLGLILDVTQPLDLSIPITNRANRVITITNLMKDCSCTSLKIDKLKLAPGETATLRVVTNLTGHTGLYLGDIVVESDAVEKIDEIQIRGQITGQIRVRPVTGTLLIGDQQASGTFTVFCDNQDGKWRYAGYVAEDPHVVLQLTEKETTPTTSIYEAQLDIPDESARKSYPVYTYSLITMKFVNDELKKTLDVNYPVGIAVRRRISIDPAQVTFTSTGARQSRSVVVQSPQPMSIDTVRCDLPGLKATFSRVSEKAVLIALDYVPPSGGGQTPPDLTCELLSDGKLVGSFPINIVDIR